MRRDFSVWAIVADAPSLAMGATEFLAKRGTDRAFAPRPLDSIRDRSCSELIAYGKRRSIRVSLDVEAKGLPSSE
jgi:hypothetical protein